MRRIRPYIDKIDAMLPNVLAADRLFAKREIQRWGRVQNKPGSKQDFAKRFDRLQQRLAGSRRKRDRRLENLPDLRFNEDLPIFDKKDEIIKGIRGHPVIVVSGETGSGKTTQLPKFCLAAGRGLDGIVGCTQPRRIAATTVARRIAEELGEELGRSVGYKIRFKDRAARDTYIKMMTDGILLAETQRDRYLSAYDTIIVDEAHERSLNIDFILGFLKKLQSRRDDLKLIITSATIDTTKFSKAFGHAPVIEVSGRMYPVEVHYTEPDENLTANGEMTHVDLAVRAAERIFKQTRAGDILVFMPTEQDIRETCDLIAAIQPPGVRVLPLFARLTASEQNRVFARSAERKIIVATNVAETSITIPGIKYVIDSGLARISRYSPRTRTTSLPITPVSQSSADQRRGRCGRVENGVCIRLFTEEDYEARPRYTPPEILRANLAEVILRMISLKLGDITDFQFIDRPEMKSIKDGFNLLIELGAIKFRRTAKGTRPKVKEEELRVKSDVRKSEVGNRNAEVGKRGADRGSGGVGFSVPKSNKQIRLTEKGRLMARIPLDPRLSRMLIEARKEGCIPEIAIIAAVLSIQDPRERPVEKTREADLKHAEFDDPESDFLTYLNIWRRYHLHWQKVKSNNQMKRYCREHFISYKRMREWRDVNSQIRGILDEHNFSKLEVGSRKPENGKKKSEVGMRKAESGKVGLGISASRYEALHKSVLSGFLSNIAQKKEKNVFRAAKGREVMIFPGSGLFDRAGGWIVAAEVVETSRIFARSVANIDSTWLEELGQDLCKHTYLNPHWEKNRGEVVASEQVSLFGLIIVSDRKVSYGKVNAAEASDIFIQSALIDGDVKKPFGFMRHNQKLIEGIRDMENRFRRRDILIGEPALFSFYKERLPAVYDIRKLSKFLKRKGNDRFLRMNRDDLLLYDPDKTELALFPDRLEIAGHSFQCAYAFEPGETNDGITVKIPETIASSVPAESLDWMVPGFYSEKIEGLIKGLPKKYRKKLMPVKDTVEIICREMPKTEHHLVSALGKFIYQRFRVDIPAAAWSDKALPEHLKMRIAITAPDGKELRVGRDPSVLHQKAAGSTISDEFDDLRRKWEKTALTAWDFGDLPEDIREPGQLRDKWIAYPALEKDQKTDKSVNLRLFQHRDKARAVHPEGVLALYCILFAKDLKFLKRRLTLPPDQASLADHFGGARQFERRLYQHIVRKLFWKDFRTRKEFYNHAEANGPHILSSGRRFLESSLMVLSAYHAAIREIGRLAAGDHVNPKIQALFDGLKDELQRLVPENFIELYDEDRFIHLTRYIKALMVRGQRALHDYEKDQTKAAEIRGFAEDLNRILKSLSSSASDEKRQAVEDYFWMLEEYKVSVFAQELKTAIPISAKRLKQKLGQIERMI